MNKIYLILSIILLSSCTTPKTVLKNDDTGQVVTCGGNTSSSVMLGAVGYYMQKSDDGNCVADYQEQGFKRIKTDPKPGSKSN